MSTTTMQMVQLNLRIDRQDKRQAEEVLHLMGTTTTQLVRKVLAKVARGAKDYEEIVAVLDGTPAVKEQAAEASIDPVLLEGWAIGERFMQSLGYESMDDVPRDERTWDEMYEDAMMAKALEKGWLS